jgi:hypothetical protein
MGLFIPSLTSIIMMILIIKASLKMLYTYEEKILRMGIAWTKLFIIILELSEKIMLHVQQVVI